MRDVTPLRTPAARRLVTPSRARAVADLGVTVPADLSDSVKETTLTPVAPSPLPVRPAPLEELQRLIADQDRDARTGHRVWSCSLDALPSGADLADRPARLTVSDDRHGSLYCYVRLFCRCDRCRAASATYARARRARRAA